MVYSVLVIEDEANIRLFVTANLRARSYSVFEAGTGMEGLELIRSVRPDLVILDMFLPDISGWDVLQAMAEDDRVRATPVLLMTAALPSKDESTYPNVVQRVVKPASLTTLLSVVQTALASH